MSTPTNLDPAKSRGPNPHTVADGYSLSDRREPVTGPDLDFNYENEGGANPNALDYQGDKGHSASATPTDTRLTQSHQGEHKNDFGDIQPVPINFNQCLFAFCAALNSCNLGYDIGVNTQAGPLVQDDMGLSDVQLEIFFGSLNLFAMVGALVAHWITDSHGRRHAFVVAAIVFICGVAILVVAQNFSALMVGRVFIGLGVGFGLAIDPLYISEMTPASHRGELVTWSEIAVNVGIVLGFASGLIFGYVPDSSEWRFMFGLGGIMPIIVIFLARWVMPESPRWLVAKGRHEEAQRVLELVYPPGYNVQPVLLDIQESLEREAIAGRGGWDMIIFPAPSVKRMLIVGLGIAMAQQATGIDAIQYFLLYIIEEAGVEERSAQTGILIALGLMKLFFIVVGGKLFDRRGRRPLFFASLCGMALALHIISINFFGSSYNSGLAIFGLAAYLSFFSIGMGPGAWLIPSEVFPNVIRAKAMSVATFLNRVVATLMTSTFLSTANAMSYAGFFLLLSVICLIVLAFIYFYLPETKGRSLEDMTLYFAEITGDRSILEAEAQMARDRAARFHAEAAGSAAPTFEPARSSQQQQNPEALKEAKVTGTMA